MNLIIDKTKLAFILGITLGPFWALVEKYIFSDWQTAVSLMFLVGIDTILGIAKHWKYNTISSKGFGQFGIKVLVYFMLVLAGSIAEKAVPIGIYSYVTLYFNGGIKTFIIVRELLSIIENSAVLYPGAVPKWLTKKLKQFDENGYFIPDNKDSEPNI